MSRSQLSENIIQQNPVGIQRPSENGFMEPKYLAFRFGDYTPQPLIIWAMKKHPGCLRYIGDEILPRYIGIIIL